MSKKVKKRYNVGEHIPKGTVFYKKVFGAKSGTQDAKLHRGTNKVILTMEMVEDGVAAVYQFNGIGMKVRCGHVKVLAVTDRKGNHLTGSWKLWSGQATYNYDKGEYENCYWTLGKRKKIADFNINSAGCGIGIHGFLTFHQATRYIL